MELKIASFCDTTVGLIREVNEDSCVAINETGFFGIFDGMGGHAAGNIASYTAAKALKAVFTEPEITADARGIRSRGTGNTALLLADSIKIANRCLYDLAYRYEQLRGMGTTAVCCLFEGDIIHTANVGDSRLYRLRGTEFTQITKDHSWVNEMIEDEEITKEEAKKFKKRNVLTRVLGVRPAVKVDLRSERAQKGDIYLLCSDGLTTATEDSEIKRIVVSNKKNLNAIGEKLLEQANLNGGEDNTTVVVLKVESASGESFNYTGEIDKLVVAPEEDEKTLKVEDKIAKKIIAGIDLSGFDPELFLKKPKFKKKMLVILLFIFVIPLVVFLIKDFFRGLDSKPFSGKPGAGIQAQSLSANSDEGQNNASQIAKELKALLPKSEPLHIKREQ